MRRKQQAKQQQQEEGWVWAGKFWPGEVGGVSCLPSSPGQFHPSWWPSPSTCAKECAWERRPGGGRGSRAAATRRQHTGLRLKGAGLRRDRDPEHPRGCKCSHRRARLPLNALSHQWAYLASPRILPKLPEFSVLSPGTGGQGAFWRWQQWWWCAWAVSAVLCESGFF